MDASDRLRRVQTRTIWIDYKAQKLTPQGGSCPPVTCVALNTGCSLVKYTSYEQRQVVAEGRMNCSPCATNGGPPCY
jgi:hypothetical protein